MASQPTDLGRPVQEGDVFGPYADLYPGQVITTPCGRVFTVEPDGKHIRCTHVPPSTPSHDSGTRSPKQSSRPTRESGQFDGRSAAVYRSPGTTNVLYGGSNGNVPGDGHGHVRATGGPTGENVVFWRLPEDEGGQTIVDNSWDITEGNDLR